MKWSTASLLVCYLLIVATHLYYPKWQMEGTEATISYDVSGYYLYLPATFIYNDLKQLDFLPEVIDRYRPTYDPYQAYRHESGNMVMKYSVGQAVTYAPFFLVAHLYASVSEEYAADGFSRPYQFMVSLGSLIISFIGLCVLMRVLRRYFSPAVVGLTLLLIVAGTNYLNYSAIDGAMTHNTVFTLYALLIWCTDRLYRRPPYPPGDRLLCCFYIGLLLGLMALTRPTEILAVVIPLCWGVVPSKTGFERRLSELTSLWIGVTLAAVTCVAVGSLQLIYWKYVTGDWIVYSYQDQGFDWFSPHLTDGLFSYKAGWLTYTPLMWFGLLGFIPLYLFYRRRGIFLAPLVHTVLFIYVAFAWSVWWYGGSLGQRTMVQAYAVLAFPLAATVDWVSSRAGRWVSYVFGGICLLFICHNLWFTHQAHRGGLFVTEWMNRSYYWRTLFTFERNNEDRLLLDNPEFYRGIPERIDTIYTESFEDRPVSTYGLRPIDGNGSIVLVGEESTSEEYRVRGPFPRRQWVRATIDARTEERRNNVHNYSQLVLRFYRDGERVKERIIRLHRVLNDDFGRSVTIEARAPWDGADEVSVLIWNGGDSQPTLVIDNLVVATLE